MRKFMKLVCVLVVVATLLSGCAKDGRPAKDEPQYLILGTWIETHEGKNDKLYETKGAKISFYADGTTSWGEDSIWLLQGNYLTIEDRKHYVKSLTEDELIFTEKENPEGSYSVWKRLAWGDWDVEIPDDYEERIVGHWENPRFPEYYIRFNADGTGEKRIEDPYAVLSFSWKILQGNRLRIVYDESYYGKTTTVELIKKCDENELLFAGMEGAWCR